MSERMTGDKAVKEVVKLLNRSTLPNFRGRAYYYERPEKMREEYIVVNHLPFVHRRASEEAIVNVNVHVPDHSTNEPASERLSELVDAIIALFDPKGTYLNGSYYEFYADSRPIEEKDNTHFVNLQILVRFNNLHY